MRPVIAVSAALLLALAAGWAGAQQLAPQSPADPTAIPEEEARALAKMIFLPDVPPPVEDKPDTTPVIGPQPPPPPTPPPPGDKPEDFMFLTGIMDEGDRLVAQVEDRRTRQVVLVKKGDPLGEGVVLDIGKYDVTVKEWTVTRQIPLGYSVSGRPDTLVPPPAAAPPAAAPQVPQVRPGGFQFGGRSGTPQASAAPSAPSAADSGLPQFPSRDEWLRWSEQQRQDFVRRRNEAVERARRAGNRGETRRQ